MLYTVSTTIDLKIHSIQRFTAGELQQVAVSREIKPRWSPESANYVDCHF